MEAKYDCVARYSVKVRTTPDTLNTSSTRIVAGESFQISEIVADRLDPLNPQKVWGKIFGGKHNNMFTALEYPNNDNPISTYKIIDNTQTTAQPIGRDGKFIIVNPDYNQRWRKEDVKDVRYSYKVSRLTRNRVPYTSHSTSGKPIGHGAPATARFMVSKSARDHVNFTQEFQEFIHGINCEVSGQSDEENKRSFSSIFRDNVMMCDFGGTWSRKDYINNNDKSPYIALKPMVCGGTLLRAVGESTIYGNPCWLVEGINEFVFKDYHPKSHPWLFFRPIISIRLWTTDKKGNYIKKEEHYAEPFPQYNMNSVLPVLGTIPDSRSITGYVGAVQKFRSYVLSSSSPVPNPFIIRGGITKENPYKDF